MDFAAGCGGFTRRGRYSMRYTRTAIFLHWLTALLIFGQIVFGWYLDSVPRNTPARSVVVNFHKSTGIILGVVILIRLLWRVTHRAPGLPTFVPGWERAVAQVSHFGLYVCMILMPLSGYVASNFSKWGVNFFNSVKIPAWGPDNHALYAVFNTTHVITSYVFVALIALHLIAALNHAVRKDGVFSRMLPGG
jgi:cytochrome b561